MGTAHVLADSSVIERLERNADNISIVDKSFFGEGLWLILVESSQLPDGYWYAREIVIWDTCGPVPAKLKVWAEL